MEQDEPATKKTKNDADDGLEKTIEKQNKELYALRDKLKANTNQSTHVAILKANNQSIPEESAEVS